MTLQQFIRKNKARIDSHILSVCRNVPSLDDDAREEWIANDVALYQWAQDEGVTDL